MTELKVPALTIEMKMDVYQYLPIEHKNQGDDGLDGEPVADPSIIYIASDEGLLMSFSYTHLIDDLIQRNTSNTFPIFDEQIRGDLILLRNYLLKQAEKLNNRLPVGDKDRVVVNRGNEND